MLRVVVRVFVALGAGSLAAVIGAYLLLVAGSRRGVEYYYGN
jgi:hypothetical protein